MVGHGSSPKTTPLAAQSLRQPGRVLGGSSTVIWWDELSERWRRYGDVVGREEG